MNATERAALIDQYEDGFQAARAATAPILHRLDEEQWRRAGTHSESGAYTVEDWLRIYGGHAHDHADQIRRARATEAG